MLAADRKPKPAVESSSKARSHVLVHAPAEEKLKQAPSLRQGQAGDFEQSKD